MAIYRAFGPWVLGSIVAYAIGGIAATWLFRRGTPAARTWGVAALAFASLFALQIAFVGNDAFASVRSAAPILAAAERANGGPLDPGHPVFQVGSYDQTLCPSTSAVPLVAFVDEMRGPGLDARASTRATTSRAGSRRGKRRPRPMPSSRTRPPPISHVTTFPCACSPAIHDACSSPAADPDHHDACSLRLSHDRRAPQHVRPTAPQGGHQRAWRHHARPRQLDRHALAHGHAGPLRRRAWPSATW